MVVLLTSLTGLDRLAISEPVIESAELVVASRSRTMPDLLDGVLQLPLCASAWQGRWL